MSSLLTIVYYDETTKTATLTTEESEAYGKRLGSIESYGAGRSKPSPPPKFLVHSLMRRHGIFTNGVTIRSLPDKE